MLDLGGFALLAGPGGAELVAADEVCATGAPMLEGRWYELRLMFQNGQVRLRQTALQTTWGTQDSGEAQGELHPATLHRILFGARPDGEVWTESLDGRLEDPAIFPALIDDPAPIEPDAHPLIAWWDFSEHIGTQQITDRGPHAWHGAFRNLPTRAVRGSRWRGAEHCWRHAPRDYAAVHLAADDLYDCNWQTSFEIEIPPDLRSGVYGARLRAGADEDIIPFYVLPPRGQATAPIAFLAATFTYQAYANHARNNTDAVLQSPPSRLARLPKQPRRTPGIQHQHLQPAPRQHRPRPLLDAPPHPDDAAGLPNLRRPKGLRPPPLPRRQPPHRLARNHRPTLRRHHRPRPGPRRPRPPSQLPSRHHRHATPSTTPPAP